MIRVNIPSSSVIEAKATLSIESQIIKCLMLVVGGSMLTLLSLSLMGEKLPNEIVMLVSSLSTALVALVKSISSGGSHSPPEPHKTEEAK